jgi:glycolate oxidase iron-sulfur subunit
MQAPLADFIRDTPDGEAAQAILRKCVHCGFCTATCPTYQLLGDELDGPRGRIYLIKEMLAGAAATTVTQTHLDRCLSCRACETTCPSGVEYGRLLDIGRKVAHARIGRSPAQRLQRWALRRAMADRRIFGALLGAGRAVRALLPRALRATIPRRRNPGAWPAPVHARRMLVLDGCVQPALAPRINAAAARVLHRLGISLLRVPRAGCCGALSQHLDAQDEALDFARRNIDAWWPLLEQGAEAIVMTASGCGVMVKDYGHLLALDTAYAKKAARVAELARDPVEVVGAEWKAIATLVAMDRGSVRVAFHPPCTLQHGMKLKGRAEEFLRAIGHEVVPVPDAHLCCGSAGTYSMLQPVLSEQLKKNKLAALATERPAVIATANIGCQAHLASGTSRPVRHWIELLDEKMLGRRGG